MANGLSINGVVQGEAFGLGSVVTWSSVGVPSQYMGAVNRSSKFIRSGGNSALRSLCNGDASLAVPRIVEANTCDMPGSMACNYGGPQAAFSGINGLGDVSNFACRDWAAIMTQMQTLLARAEERAVSTPAYVAARSYFDDTTGVFQKPIINCANHTAAAQQFYNALNAELGFAAPPLSAVLNPLDPASPDYRPPGETEQIAAAVKWGAIALVALAGAYALGPILRGVGSMFTRKR